MKRMFLLLAVLCVSIPCFSDDEPGWMKGIYDDLHILDNLTPATYYDIVNSQWLAGGTTELYQKWYLGANLGVAKPLFENDVNDSRALFTAGLLLHAGDLLVDKVQFFKDLTALSPFTKGLFKYATAGMWGTFDFTNREWRGGPYAGFSIPFESTGNTQTESN